MAYQIITDSSCDLSPELVKEKTVTCCTVLYIIR